MSDNLKATTKRTNHIINEQIAKIRKDTQELINRTIDGQPAQVSVVKVSENKIIIEVDLNEFNQSKKIENVVDEDTFDSSNPNKSLKQLNCSTPKSNKYNKDDSSAQPDDQSNIENVDLDGSSDKPLKGILKYTNSWKKRTLSESSFDYSSSFTDHEDDDNFILSLSCSDLDVYSADRSSKKVTFNKQISSKVFSKNQRTNDKSRPKKGKSSSSKKKNKKAKSNDDKKMPIECNKKADTPMKDTVTVDEVEVDELSFLLQSSDSDASNFAPSLAIQNKIETNHEIDNKDEIDEKDKINYEDEIDDRDEINHEDKINETSEKKVDNELTSSIEDLLELSAKSQDKIEHQAFDENWSEMKSSKKIKKNRKRNDSGNSISNEANNENEPNNANVSEVSKTVSHSLSEDNSANACDQTSKMSLGIKRNLEIQVN